MVQKYTVCGFCRSVLCSLVMAVCTSVVATAQTQTTTQRPMNQNLSNVLVKNVLLALNNANVTGNYSVLRELGTAEFQGRNSSVALHRVFAILRQRVPDMSIISIMLPKYPKPPLIQGNAVRMIGFFETRPRQINFNLGFKFVNKRWRLQSIGIGAPDAKAVPNTAKNEDSSQENSKTDKIKK